MWVYGDLARWEDTSQLVGGLKGRLLQLQRGEHSHNGWVALLIESGELAQGVLDGLYQQRGADHPTLAGRACLALCAQVAGAKAAAAWPRVEQLERLLRQGQLPPQVRVKSPEGYAFYALYPELYAYAAAPLAEGGKRLQVIGIRSIGTSLGAVVAAATGSSRLLTVRPTGHPYARRLNLSPVLRRQLQALARHFAFAIVDEGPGLSGSSFGAVADLLEQLGAPRRSLHFFTSHLGPLGPQASLAHQERWSQSQRYCIGFDQALGCAAVARWAQALVGPAVEPPRDLSGGAWRSLRFSPEHFPPANPRGERRKVWIRTARGEFLCKFVGLGRSGERSLSRARVLQRAGYCPEVLGLKNGFLVERWHGEARPLSLAGVDRKALIARVASYLAFLCRRFPAAQEAPGASPEALLAMAQINTTEALGAQWAVALERYRPQLPSLFHRRRRVEGDARLHAWEWLVLPGGALLKTDALDHHRGHDLVGCQDAGWDLAGAMVELELAPDERQRLLELFARQGGHRIERESLEFHLRCYLAFQAGSYCLAAGACPEEAGPLGKRAEHYLLQLRACLERG